MPNIRLLDPAIVSRRSRSSSRSAAFYDFNQKLDIDRYTINGTLQDYVVGVREINYDKLPGSQRNWQNQHTVYTHGYGFVAAPANQTSATARRSSSPASSDRPAARPPRPRTTVRPRPKRSRSTSRGSTTASWPGYEDYVDRRQKDASSTDIEFDRPRGPSRRSTTYNGAGGVPVGSLFRRILYALQFREANFLLSNVFNENSKLLYIRDPRERVEQVAPFLTLDGDPYPAVVDGKIVWILDGYTTASTYPYSQQVDLRAASSDAQSGTGTVLQAQQNINYIRNSVKATVDAYDGTVTLYKFDDRATRSWPPGTRRSAAT